MLLCKVKKQNLPIIEKKADTSFSHCRKVSQNAHGNVLYCTNEVMYFYPIILADFDCLHMVYPSVGLELRDVVLDACAPQQKRDIDPMLASIEV